MAIVWIDGFDSYGSTISPGVKGVTFSGSANTFVTGRGSQGLGWKSASSSAGTYECVITAVSAVAAGFGYKISALPGSTQQFFRLRHSGTQDVIIGVKSDGSLVAGSTDFSGGLFGTGAAGDISSGAYQYVEIEVVRSTTVGTITVYVNGVQKLALTGLNTGGTNYNQVAIQGNTSVDTEFDDYYIINTNARLSSSGAQLPTVYTLRPASDTATAEWTPNSGSNHFDRVNETPWDGDTTYNSCTTTTKNDLYNMDNLPTSPASIKALQFLDVAKGVGGASITGAVLKSNTTTVTALGSGGNTSYTMNFAIRETDPDTSAAWTESGVNAALGGIRCTVITGTSNRSTGMVFEVLVMLATSSTETGDGNMAFSGISFTATGSASHTGTGTMSFSGISFNASGSHQESGTGVMSFAGISMAGVAARTETGTGTMSFSGISFNAAGIVAHVHGTAVMAFAGISINAHGYLPAGPGTGRRQFWTFGA